MSTEYDVPTTGQLDAMYESLKNWGRWGADDELGMLHHLTDDRRVSATRLVVTGESISLAHDLATEPLPEHPHPVQHHMLAAGDARDSSGIPGYEASHDHLALDLHGLWTTHVDALSHMFVHGEMFGGRPASDVRSDGARANTILSMATGVVGRGVLLDIPRVRHCAYFDVGDMVTVADLEAAEEAQGIRVGSGDVLLVMRGREARRATTHRFTGFSGLHAECLPWLQEREVAALGSDGIHDPMPFVATPEWPFPVHQIGITALGLHLIDNMALASLSERCSDQGRWEFLFAMSPLRIVKGTGCPVNPVAVL
jgi:kynurenine formamidase